MMKKLNLNVVKILTAITLCSSSIIAAPSGGVVKSGNAQINQAGKTTNINQISNKASINWNSFNIKPSETVNFNQPSSSSITLNRVIGTSASMIEGAMNANGQVILVNPNGTVFSKGAKINVNGLINSTLDISDENFKNDNYIFQGDSQASIINLGTIKASNKSYVALLGKELINKGVIEAKMGSIQLASGKKITLNLNGNSLISLAIDEAMANTLIKNKGLIKADGGKVFLTTKAVNNILNTLIVNEGTVQAQTLDDLKGHVEIHAHDGTTKISGKLDASAPNGGDGGFIETSGHTVKISENTKVTTKSNTGENGKWLIDPVDYNIDSVANGGDITGATLSSNLGSGNVEIQSVNGSTGTNGDINVNESLTWSSGNTLTLTAQNDINIDADIDASSGSGGKLVLKYGQQAVAAGNTSSYNLAAGIKIDLQSGQNFDTLLGNDGVIKNWNVITDIAGVQNIASDASGNYVLGANIDASSVPNFTHIGNFSGYLNGHGHKIYSFDLADVADNALFFQLTGIIENLRIETDAPLATDKTIAALVVQNVGKIINSIFFDTQNFYYNATNGIGNGKLLAANFTSPSNIQYTYPFISTEVVYTLSDLIKIYQGTLSLSSLWSATDIFGSNYSSWIYGTDYAFTYLGSEVSSFTNVGSYTNIGIDIKKTGFTEAATGNTDGSLTINKKDLDITANDDTKSYDGLTYSGNNGVTYSGFISGEDSSNLSGSLTYSGDSQTAVNEGTYTITPGGFTSNNYNISFNNGTLTITPATLTVTAKDYTKAYDGLAYSGGNGVLYSGFISGEDETDLGGSLSFTGNSQGAINGGSYDITPTGLTSSNYTIVYNNGTLTVTPIPLTVTAKDKTKPYDGIVYNYQEGVTYSGFVNGEDASALSGTLSYTGAAKDVGTHTITPSGLSSSNYTISYADGTLTITPIPLTISANSVEKIYDGKAFSSQDNSVTYTGLVNGEDASVLSGSLTYAGDHDGAVDVGNYSIKPSGLSSGNYIISFEDGTLSVTPAPLNVTANTVEKIYDGIEFKTEDASVNYEGFVEGEDESVLSGTLTYSGDFEGVKDVGEYTISPSGLSSGNYTITFNNGSLNITPAALSVTANNDSKTYDGLEYINGNGVNYTGFVEGEDESNLDGTLKFAGDSQGAKNVGEYSISPTGLSSGNYTITFNDGTLSVTPAALSITANSVEKTYDGIEFSAEDNSVSYNGFVNGEDESVLSGALKYSGTANQAVDAGTYTISPNGLNSSNYTISFNNGTLSITPADLSVTANETYKIFDGLEYFGNNGVKYSGFVNGEDESVLSGSLNYWGDSQGASQIGVYSLNPTGLSSNNYNITFNGSTLTIIPDNQKIIDALDNNKIIDNISEYIPIYIKDPSEQPPAASKLVDNIDIKKEGINSTPSVDSIADLNKKTIEPINEAIVLKEKTFNDKIIKKEQNNVVDTKKDHQVALNNVQIKKQKVEQESKVKKEAIKEKGEKAYYNYKKGLILDYSFFELVDIYFEIKYKIKELNVLQRIAKTNPEKQSFDKEINLLKDKILKDVFKQTVKTQDKQTSLEFALGVEDSTLYEKEEVLRHFLKLLSMTKEKGET